MLILLKQSPTGLFAPDPSGQAVEIYEQLWFNSSTLTTQTNTIVDSNMLPFEMNEGQLIYLDGTTEYRYDGMGSFTTVTAPVTALYSLSVSASPAGGGLATDMTGTAHYESGEAISLSATAALGYSFVSWTRNGLVVSTSPNFVFTMPAANVQLVANFAFTETIPDPDPIPEEGKVPSTFYDLELRVNGVQIPMPPFVQKSVEGMLSDVFEGEYSYAVNIPLSPTEMAALGLPNDPQTARSFVKSLPASIWSHGNLRYNGHLDILKSDEDRIRCSFILDSGFFISQNQELKLPQCYTADDVIDISGQPVFAVVGYELRFGYNTIRITVNSISKSFTKEQYPDRISMTQGIEAWLKSLPLNLQVLVEYGPEGEDDSKIVYWDTNTVTSCHLEYYLPNRQQWATNRSNQARKLTSRRFAMDQWNQVSEANRIAFPTIYNRNLYEGNNSMHDGIVNRYDSLGRLYVSNIRYLSYSESFRWEHTIIPFLYLTDVVKQIFKHLKIEVSGEFFEDDRVKRMLLYNNRTLDFVSVRINNTPSRRTVTTIHRGDAEPTLTSHFYENTHDLRINLANHAPNYSVIQFLKGLKNYFGLKYDFNLLQNRVEIRFVRSKIRSREILDLTAQAGRVFTLHHGKESGFAFAYENPDPLMADGGQNPPPAEDEVDFTVQNFLALDGLDAELFQIAYVQSLRAWFQLSPDQSNPPFWKLYAFRQQSDRVPDGDAASRARKAWNLTLFPLVDSWIAGKKMPAIECTVNNREVNLENKECGLRIFAFYGMKENVEGHPYSFGAVTRYDAKELLSSTQYDLDIRSEDMYPLHADQERIITAGKEYESTLLLNGYNLLQLSRSPIIRIANLDYLTEEKEVQNTSQEYALAKVRLFKIK